jgi:hypothetical protein
MATAIGAVTQRMRHRLAVDPVSHGTTVTAAFDDHGLISRINR